MSMKAHIGLGASECADWFEDDFPKIVAEMERLRTENEAMHIVLELHGIKHRAYSAEDLEELAFVAEMEEPVQTPRKSRYDGWGDSYGGTEGEPDDGGMR